MKAMNLAVTFLFVFIIYNFALIVPVHASTDPLKVSNNKFGIHITGTTPEEASEAANLVNSSGGDWGYVTIVVEDSNRNHDVWQRLFDEFRVKHLIPIVRIATAPTGNFWKIPYEGEEQAWADFLDSLNWPAKNRYVVIYNEPNQAQEWGNSVNAALYAQTLNKTIDALKQKNQDFFILNAGFDASAPQKLPAYEDEKSYLIDMNTAVPGIFNKLDGWASHSYPNPGFVGSPNGSGRGSVRNYQWELSVLKDLGINKNLPVFITETGWKHAEGQIYDGSLPDSETVGVYLKEAFQGPWSDPNIVAVTPFLLDYQDSPFDHFSFKKLTSNVQNLKVLGTQYPDQDDPSLSYYPQYSEFTAISKKIGNPLQDDLGELIGKGLYPSIVADQTYAVPITIKNTGQAIWGEKGSIRLIPSLGQNELGLVVGDGPTNSQIPPGQNATFYISLHAPASGTYRINLSLFDGPQKVGVANMEFQTEVKSPVTLDIHAALEWKKSSAGDYLLSILSSVGQSTRQIILGNNNYSGQIQANELLPDDGVDVTLSKPFYQPKTVHTAVHSGINTIDFGTLKPDIGSAILHPISLWKLLPFSN